MSASRHCPTRALAQRKKAGARTATAVYTLADGSSGGLAANYSLADTTGLAATITPKPASVTANDQAKIAGEIFTFKGNEFTASGLLGGDSISSVTLHSGGADEAASAADSPFTITPSAAVGTGLGNYTIEYVNGRFVVREATLADVIAEVVAAVTVATHQQATQTSFMNVADIARSTNGSGIFRLWTGEEYLVFLNNTFNDTVYDLTRFSEQEVRDAFGVRAEQMASTTIQTLSPDSLTSLTSQVRDLAVSMRRACPSCTGLGIMERWATSGGFGQ